MSRILLTYGSSTLRQSDINLLKPNNWLNDQIILFFYEYLQSTSPNSDSLLIDPSTSFILLIEDDEEDLAEGLSQINFQGKRLIFFPVNNHLDPGINGGSHWTLLVNDLASNRAFYYDSLNSKGQNYENALIINRKISRFLKIDEPVVRPVIVRQPQINSCDCGVFVAIITEYLYRSFDFEFHQPCDIGPHKAERWRRDLIEIIEKIRSGG
jgi:Ulp1 family protease